MTSFYKFHIDEPEQEQRQKFDAVPQLTKFFTTLGSSAYHCVFELGTKTKKPHYQGWFIADPKGERKFKGILKKQLTFLDVKGRGRQIYSLKEITDMDHIKNYEEYMCKGGEVVITTLTPERIEELTMSRALKGAKASAPKDKAKSFMDRLYEEAVSVALQPPDMVGDRLINYLALPQLYLKLCPKQLDKFLMERNLNGLTNRLEQEYPCPQNQRLRRKMLHDLKESNYGEIYF